MRRGILAAIPVLLLAVILQSTIASRIILLSGNADLVLLVVVAWGLQERVRGAWIWGVTAGLVVGMVSGVPWYIYLIGYLSVVGLARLLVHRIWQAPLLVMFGVTLIGTLELLMLTFVQLMLFEGPLALNEVFSQIVLPTIILNLLLAIPIHALMHDLANWLYPEKVTG
jgi:cell shape-determining protein MreD